MGSPLPYETVETVNDANAALVCEPFALPLMPELPLTLGPGEVVAIPVQYTPFLDVYDEETLFVLSNDQVTPQLSVLISGKGTEPIQLEGETEGEVVEGEGEVVEGEGEIVEGEGEVVEGEGEVVEGEGEIIEGEGEIIEGEGEIVEGEGEIVEGEGEVVEGEGEITEGEIEGEGEPEEGEIVEGEGEIIEGEVAEGELEGEGEPIEGEGESVEGEGEEYCLKNLLEDGIFASGDLTAYWDDSQVASSAALLCSSETCPDEWPLFGDYWVRFCQRETDDELAFGQQVNIPQADKVTLEYYYRASEMANGRFEVYLGDVLVDAVNLPEMNTGNVYELRTVEIAVADTPMVSLLEFVNPALGDSDIHIDALCLRAYSDMPEEGESTEGELEGESVEGEGEVPEGEGELPEGENEGELVEGEGEIAEGEPIEGEPEGELMEGEGEIIEGEGEVIEGESSEGESVEGEIIEGEGEIEEGEVEEGEIVEGEDTAIITCTVLDAATGDAIIDAMLYTVPESIIVTDSLSGAYLLIDVPVGFCTIVVEATDYYTDRQAITVNAGDDLQLTFHLKPLVQAGGEQLPDEGEGESTDGEIEGEGEADSVGWCRGCHGLENTPEDTKRLFGDWLLIGLSMLVLGSIVKQ